MVCPECDQICKTKQGLSSHTNFKHGKLSDTPVSVTNDASTSVATTVSSIAISSPTASTSTATEISSFASSSTSVATNVSHKASATSAVINLTSEEPKLKRRRAKTSKAWTLIQSWCDSNERKGDAHSWADWMILSLSKSKISKWMKNNGSIIQAVSDKQKKKLFKIRPRIKRQAKNTIYLMIMLKVIRKKTNLKSLREENLNCPISAQINIISIRNIFQFPASQIMNNKDFLLVSKTKLEAPFLLDGLSRPYSLDCYSNGSGILLFVKDEIFSRLLTAHT